MSKENDRTTISVTKEAKKVLDTYGKKNENYSDVVMRMAKDCGCRSANTDENQEKVEEDE